MGAEPQGEPDHEQCTYDAAAEQIVNEPGQMEGVKESEHIVQGEYQPGQQIRESARAQQIEGGRREPEYQPLIEVKVEEPAEVQVKDAFAAIFFGSFFSLIGGYMMNAVLGWSDPHAALAWGLGCFI